MFATRTSSIFFYLAQYKASLEASIISISLRDSFYSSDFLHSYQTMAAVSVNLVKFTTSLNQSIHPSQITGRASSLKLVSAAWVKSSTAFPASFRTSRLRVCCSAKPATVEKVCEIVRKQLALPPESELTSESKFSALGADSLDTVEIVMGLEEEFDIVVEEDSSQNITTVREAADLIEKLLEKKNQSKA